MSSSKQQMSISRVMNILKEWDNGITSVRKQILNDFVVQSRKKTGPDLEQSFTHAASLLLTRFTAWLRLTYMTGTCVTELLCAITVFLSASSGHTFMAEFMEVGGALTLLEIIGLKQAKEKDKAEALKCLYHITNAGRQYKELICESYGIRAIAECLAKSKSEKTQGTCKNLLLLLAQGNPKFQNQVYKGLIALLPASSPKAQQLACNALRIVQPIVGSVNSAIIDPLLNLLRTLHIEIQFEAIEMLKDFMKYQISDLILARLVYLLRPTIEETLDEASLQEEINGHPDVKGSITLFIQQAAAAKAIGILARESNEVAEKLIQLRVTHNLLYAMGNADHADSQRQSGVALEYFCRTFSIVDDHVRDAMGETLYDLFMLNSETLYLNMTHIQADVLLSNKVNVPKSFNEVPKLCM